MESWIDLETLRNGGTLHLTGSDYTLPGPEGWRWKLTAATGDVTLERVEQSNVADWIAAANLRFDSLERDMAAVHPTNQLAHLEWRVGQWE